MSSYETQAFWDGEWHNEGNNVTFAVFNPSTGEKIADVADCGLPETIKAISSAKEAFKSWSKTSAKQRAAIMHKIKDILIKDKEQIATILTKENGKPIQEAIGEVVFAASFFEWFAEECRRQYGDTIPSNASNKRMITIRQPLGVAALIMPSNFPIGMVGRKVAAALAAGCTCIIKPAEDTPLIALHFVKICHDAGVPKGVINVIPCSRGRIGDVGDELCRSKDIQALSFTGSTTVGKMLYTKCGNTMKKLGLELGGNAPFIVFSSANIDAAVKGAMAAKFRNAGQACIAANRFYVHESIHDEFISRFSASMDSELKVGDGFDPEVTQGPIINNGLLQKVHNLVKEAINEGAVLAKGGKLLGGLFYAPTLLTGVTPKMKIVKEEIFGPVATVLKFKDESNVIAMANDTEVGLAGYFYSNDLSQVWRVAEELQFGMIGVNEPMISTCEIPFGGIKMSGLGKEGSRFGLEEFTIHKYICLGV